LTKCVLLIYVNNRYQLHHKETVLDVYSISVVSIGGTSRIKAVEHGKSRT